MLWVQRVFSAPVFCEKRKDKGENRKAKKRTVAAEKTKKKDGKFVV